MAVIEWSESFNLGIPDIDSEHRALIDLINRLHARLGPAASNEEIFEFFVELHAQIARHFALEETIMRDLRYDRLRAHKDDHEKLLDEIRDLMDRQLAGEFVNYDAVLGDALRQWFVVHFKTEDARLHRWLRGGHSQ